MASIGNLAPTSFVGLLETIGMNSPDDFIYNGHWRYGNWQRSALRQMYGTGSWLGQAANQTLDAVDVIEFAARPKTIPPAMAQSTPIPALAQI